MARQRGEKARAVPSKAELLEFITSRPGKVGNREIARAFGITGRDRIDLKNLLRELSAEGHVERRRKKLHRAGSLPSVVLADIAERDSDGEWIAIPTEWDEDAHGEPPRIRLSVPRRQRPAEAAGIGDRALVRVEKSDDEVAPYRGRVIKLVDRAKHRMLGIFRALPGGAGRLSPVEKKRVGAEISIPASATGEAHDGDLVIAEITKSVGYGLPSGRVIERLGSLATEKSVSQIAIHAHGIPHVFPRAALAEASAAKPADVAGREDWRLVPFVTIDPADAKDHDDAVHAVADTDPANPAGYIISVAIADVAHYVRSGSALDREALLRGNSVYFPDRVVPMLPERISNDLCSLNAGADRPAIAVRIVISADGRKRSHAFRRVLMRSAAKLSYEQVQRGMDAAADAATEPFVPMVIEPLYAAYEAIKRARDERSPLELDLPERKILLEPDGTVDRVITPERLDSHRLIEEFMILANVAAAETLERAHVPFIYRVHDQPSFDKVAALREFLRTLDVALPKADALRPADFNRILARVEGTDVEKLVHEVVLRTQSQAEYAAENYGHYGLNLRRYAHFTSPIRRYADVVVHRALYIALKFATKHVPEPPDLAALREIAAKISAAERRAMTAERETSDRLIAHFLAEKVGATFEGHISGVTRAGLFVKLDETGADGFVPIRTLLGDYFRYEEAQHALIGRATGETHRLGDRVRVRLEEAIPVAGALRLKLLSEGRFSARLRHRSRKQIRGGKRQ